MKLRASFAAAGAAVIVGSSAFALPALASSHTTTHTLKFISVTKRMISFSKTSIGAQDTDVNKAGKVVGFDEIYGAATSATTSASDVTVVTKGGMLYGTFIYNAKTGAITDGKVTGGTGAFKGASGTFAVKAISNNKTAVTVTYTT
jgi:hypothetical protein